MPDKGKKAGRNVSKAGHLTVSQLRKLRENNTFTPGTQGFTAVMTDADGNVVSERSGTLESSSIDEAFEYGGEMSKKNIARMGKEYRERMKGY